MPDITKLLIEVEESLYSSETDIIECLNKTRVIAIYYNDTHIVQWIENELVGYSQAKEEDFPDYRRVKAVLYTPAAYINQIVGVRYDYDKILGNTEEHPYMESISEVVRRSEEEIIKMMFYHDGKQVSFKIFGSDLNNIITKIRLLLTDYIHEKVEEISKRPYEIPLMKIFNRFHRAAKHLEKRYNNRKTLIINDEYDTQDFLRGLLSIEFDSIQDEEYGPRFAGKRPRIDFFLRLENFGIEVKKVRDKDHAKNLNKEIIIDKEYYSNNPNITELYFFIYDPDYLLLNREDFIEDLEKNKSEQFDLLKIVIKPDL